LTCTIINELGMDEWGKALLAPLNGGRYPLGASFELTDRCNLSCVHCFINQPAGSCKVRQQELNLDQVKNILDKMAANGTLFLLLTGGEPLLRQDFADIYIHAKQLGMMVTLFTNGTMITPEIADMLADMPPQAIEISLYGATAETYESVTRLPGYFERCMDGIQLLNEHHLPLGLKAILLQNNVHELDAMKRIAKDFDLQFRYDGLIWPRTDGDEATYAQRLPVEELVKLDLADEDRIEEWRKTAKKSGQEPIRKEFVFNCGGGMHSYHIDSQGKMSLCLMVRTPSFDLKEIEFLEAWENIGRLRNLERKLQTKCEMCTVNALCSQCPGWSQVVHDDYETPVDYVCELAGLREKLIVDK